MSDEKESPAPGKELAAPKRDQKSYSEAEVHVAIAAVQLNGGNIARTSIAIDIPESTLRGWVHDYEAGKLSTAIVRGVKERRGNLAAKLEDKIHSVVESITDAVIQKASLSQRGVFIGIGLDKLAGLRRIDEDPGLELFRLIGVRPEELPLKLELNPGEEIPEGLGPIIETVPSSSDPNSFEVQPVQPTPADPLALEAHAPECATLDPIFPDPCDCGADERNAARAAADADQPIN